MNARLIRFIAAVASAVVVSVTGAGMANAATAGPRGVPVAGHAATQDAGQYLRQLHDYLAGAARHGDVAAVQAAVENLRPALAAVAKAPVERSALVLNDRAAAQAAQVERDLPGLSILGSVGSLLNALLATLMDLVSGLLGSVPVPMPPPLPLPPVPDVPAPGVPAPGMPIPDVPAPGGR
jgi:hypothetical protein